MKLSQKIYDSTSLSNIINKEHSIHFHKKNLNQIKKKRSKINNFDEDNPIFSPARKRSLLNNQNLNNLNEDFELSLVNKKIFGRLQTIICSPSRVKYLIFN